MIADVCGVFTCSFGFIDKKSYSSVSPESTIIATPVPSTAQQMAEQHSFGLVLFCCISFMPIHHLNKHLN